MTTISMKPISSCLAIALYAAAAGNAVASTYTYAPFDVPGASSTSPSAIDRVGNVAGTYSTGSLQHGFMYTAATGTFTTIDYPGSTLGTIVTGLNDRGQVLGYYFGSDTSVVSFVYVNGRFKSFSIDGQSATYAQALNDAGVYVGFTGLAPPQGWSARRGSSADLSEGGLSTVPQSVNRGGTVAGYTSALQGQAGFTYSEGTYTDYRYPGAAETVLTGINDAGTLVGNYGITASRFDPRHGFVLDAGVYTPLADAPGSAGTFPRAINDAGIIVGWSKDAATGLYRGFLMTPAP